MGGGGGGASAPEDIAAALEDMRLSAAAPAVAPPIAAEKDDVGDDGKKKQEKEEEEEQAEEEEEDPFAFEDFILDGAPDEYLDPISLSLMKEPVLATDEHFYERSSLEAWMEQCQAKGQPLSSPRTGALMEPGFLRNGTLRRQILGYVGAKTKAWEERKREKGGGGKGKEKEWKKVN
jgi:hypothetical protein